MTRQGPNYQDDPRLETDTAEPTPVITELDRRTNRRGADMARVAMGKPEQYSLDSKIEFESAEAQRIARLAGKSDLSSPQIKARIVFMIEAAERRGADVLSADEAAGLRHYLDNAEGFDDNLGRDLDFRERQAAS